MTQAGIGVAGLETTYVSSTSWWVHDSSMFPAALHAGHHACHLLVWERPAPVPLHRSHLSFSAILIRVHPFHTLILIHNAAPIDAIALQVHDDGVRPSPSDAAVHAVGGIGGG